MPPSVLVALDSSAGDRSPEVFAQAIAPLLGASVSPVTVAVGDEVLDDSAAAGLQRVMAAESPELVVVGSAHGAFHGRTWIGSTVDRVVHGASCAVAVVPRGYAATGLRSIAVGLLPTAESRRALHVAAALARAAHAPLKVLMILRRSPAPREAATLAARMAPDAIAAAGSPAMILQAAIRSAAREAGDDLDVQPEILVGDPAETLLRASGQLGLLVLGSRSYGPPGVVLPGGVIRRVLSGARCPVLLVPRSAAQ